MSQEGLKSSFIDEDDEGWRLFTEIPSSATYGPFAGPHTALSRNHTAALAQLLTFFSTRGRVASSRTYSPAAYAAGEASSSPTTAIESLSPDQILDASLVLYDEMLTPMLSQLEEARYTDPLTPVVPPESRVPESRYSKEQYESAGDRAMLCVGTLVDGMMGVWGVLTALGCDDGVMVARVGLLTTYVVAEPLLGNDSHRAIQVCRSTVDVVDRLRDDLNDSVLQAPMEVGLRLPHRLVQN